MDSSISLTLFACFPHCLVSRLGFFDWLVILFFMLVVYFSVSMLRKAAFSSFAQRQNDWIWHLPRFAFVVFVVSFVTVAPLIMLFDFRVAGIYIRTLLPLLCIGVYLLWLGSK